MDTKSGERERGEVQFILFQPGHSKSYNLHVCPAETKICLRVRTV